MDTSNVAHARNLKAPFSNKWEVHGFLVEGDQCSPFGFRLRSVEFYFCGSIATSIKKRAGAVNAIGTCTTHRKSLSTTLSIFLCILHFHKADMFSITTHTQSSSPLPFRGEDADKGATSPLIARVKNVGHATTSFLVAPPTSGLVASGVNLVSLAVAMDADFRYTDLIRGNQDLRRIAPAAENATSQIRFTNLGFAVTGVYNLAREGAGKSMAKDICEKFPRDKVVPRRIQEDPVIPHRGIDFLLRVASSSDTALDSTVIARGLKIGHQLNSGRIDENGIEDFADLWGTRINLSRKVGTEREKMTEY